MHILESLHHDLRFALRSLLRRPGLTLPAVATLALGIGATTAIFSVVHGVLIQPLPLPEPERLVRLYQAYPERGEERGTVSQLDAEDWARASGTLDGVAVYSTLADGLTLTGSDRPEKLVTAHVSGGFFATLGTGAARGRVLTESDAAGDDRVVVISDGLWRRRLGADPAVVGKPLTLNGEPMTVAGVMPPSFRFPDAEVEAWALLSRIREDSIPRQRFIRWLEAVGRLAPGSSLPEAEEELSAIAARLAAEHPDSNGEATAVAVEPLRREMVATVRPALLLLLAAVGALLLVACVNVANLMLARGVGRAGELAVRASLGAGRGRLVRQLLVETLVVALAGGALGVVLAAWSVEALLGLAADLLPRAAEVRVDGTVLAFAAATALATALVAGVLPALRSSRPALEPALRRSGRGGEAGGPARLHDGLVAVEIALAMALVVSSGLLARSLGEMLTADTGFAADRLLSLTVIIPAHRYPERPQFMAQHHRLLAALDELPGVESAASIKVPPLAGGRGAESLRFAVEGRPVAAGDEPEALWYPVSRGFFRTTGVPLIAGRDFDEGDGAEAPTVAVINRELARRWFGGEDPVGRKLSLGEESLEIVGVAADARHVAVTEAPEPILYLHQEQVPRRVLTYLLRTRGEPAAMMPAVREAVWAVDPEQTIARLAPLRELVVESVGLPRLVAALVGLFSALALGLAAIGVYGVVSFAVVRRRREIGVRLALGADGRRVAVTVLRRAMAAVALGVAAGLALAGAGSRLIGSLLYGVSAADPVSYLGAAVALALVALAACLGPARRAAAIDPMTVLREG